MNLFRFAMSNPRGPCWLCVNLSRSPTTRSGSNAVPARARHAWLLQIPPNFDRRQIVEPRSVATSGLRKLCGNWSLDA